jgi:hypothetical protein
MPAGNRPSSREPDGTSVLGGGITAVGAAHADPSGAPQAKQKRLSSGISAEQDGRRTIKTYPITGVMLLMV